MNTVTQLTHTQTQPQSPRDRTIRQILDQLAEEDDKNPQGESNLRRMALMANEIADEHGIAQPTPQASQDPGPAGFDFGSITLSDPIQSLADTLRRLTYAQMMRISRELKALNTAAFDTPEAVASTLDTWATKVSNKEEIQQLLPLPLPQTQTPAEATAQGLMSSPGTSTLLPPVLLTPNESITPTPPASVS